MAINGGGGKKRSSLLTFRRRLLIVRLLMRGPQPADTLIGEVQRTLGDEGYPPAAPAALKHDLDAIKNEFGCVIRFKHAIKCYELEDLGELRLLDLPDHLIETLSFLEASFPSEHGISEQTNVHVLISTLVAMLPTARQDALEQRRKIMRLKLHEGSASRIERETLLTIQRAIAGRQELSFDYTSPGDEHSRWHRVAPYHISASPEGHMYLDATMLEAVPPIPKLRRNALITYRLDRVVTGTARVLPQMLPHTPPAPPAYTLRYRLAPAIARQRDFTLYFPLSKPTYHEDGSATVEASITNLWQARHILLRYGAGCVVDSPPELVALFRETADGLYTIYGSQGAKAHGE